MDDTAATQRPFLWMIERDPPAFLFGTIHLADDRIMTIPPVLEAAFEMCDALYTEIPMDIGAMAREMAPRMMLPDEKSLKSLLPADVWEKADKYLRERGMSMAAMDRFQVWAAGMQIGLLDLMKELGSFQGLDMHLFQEARTEEKETGGLETLAEQLAAMEGLTEKEQIHGFGKAIDRLEKLASQKRRMGRELLDCYFEGDAKGLIKLMDEWSDPSDPIEAKSMDLLITQRDKRMAERIDQRLKENPGRVYLFAIGAYHLIGPKVNVITHLQDRGFKIRQLTPKGANELRVLHSRLKAERKKVAEKTNSAPAK